MMVWNKKSYTKRKLTDSERGYKHGYRSGLEDKIGKQITYEVPMRKSKYTPDFKLPKKGGFFYVETKGIFDLEDRKKHQLIREQHPDIDIRFVFSNANNKLYKGSKTTYGSWCDKHGFLYEHKTIPEEWLSE